MDIKQLNKTKLREIIMQQQLEINAMQSYIADVPPTAVVEVVISINSNIKVQNTIYLQKDGATSWRHNVNGDMVIIDFKLKN